MRYLDPELTLGQPLSVSLTSGMNAIAQAAAGLYSKDANLVTDLMAQEVIRALAQALPALKHDAGDLGTARCLKSPANRPSAAAMCTRVAAVRF
jgi:alcohol dehydrogenase class IV